MPTVAEILAQAKALHQAGDLRNAEQCYRTVLSADAANSEAYYLLGAACQGLGRLDEAIAMLQQATRLSPESAEVSATLERALAAKQFGLGNALAGEGRLDEAVACYRRALELKLDSVDAHNNLGVVLARQEKLDEAVACFRRALVLRPDSADAYDNLGVALTKQAELDEAAACFRRALELKPDHAGAYYNLADVAIRQNNPDLARWCLLRAIERQPDLAEAHYNLAGVALRENQLEEAAAGFRRAIELRPDYVDARNNLAVVLRDLKRLDEAADCLRIALAQNPDNAEAHYNLALVLTDQDKLELAAASCRRALELKPDYAEAHHSLAVVLGKQSEFESAVAAYRRALELKPDFPESSSNLAVLLAQQGRIAEARDCYRKALEFRPGQQLWRLNLISLCPSVFNHGQEIERYRQELLLKVEQFDSMAAGFELRALSTSNCTPPFHLQFHAQDIRPIREAYARVFCSSCFAGESPTGSAGRPRIGIVVTDGHEGLFLRSLGGVLERIDERLFELVVVGSDRGLARMRSAIANPAIGMLPIPGRFDQVVEIVRAARFDVLYYWEVGTDPVNYFLPFLRLAPLQCTSWGIQVTSGIPQMDYYLSSALVEPEDAASHYSEKLLLASTLLTYQERVSAPRSPRPRESFGVGADQHLYLCAQQLGKFHPDFDPILSGILRRDARGVIVVTEERYGRFTADLLRRRFAATIPDVAQRIVFVPFQPTADYLSLVSAADVLLDPLHFGGVNSTYDGFSLNQPIVTLPSRFHRGRYTLGCYRKMGVLDCVAASAEQYVDIAVSLGTDAQYRASIVDKIRQASGALFEDPAAVSEHERLFAALVDEARSARRADHA